VAVLELLTFKLETMINKSTDLQNSTNPPLLIASVISRFSEVNTERNELNRQIGEYYKPLLTEAAKNKDKAEYDRLLSELPDCPFVMTAYRIGELNGL
jgi:hypothetical protein